jgi:hypothetical protein
LLARRATGEAREIEKVEGRGTWKRETALGDPEVRE